jgi:gamma-glutamylcyclotransferase (GGCT)/AIG2-like uncharacterized protein YtfP
VSAARNCVADKLFVYGTLMVRAGAAPLGREMRWRLRRAGTWLGSATLPGTLVDLGLYPAAVDVPARDGPIHGEIYRLARPRAVFRWLDRYEDATDQDAPSPVRYVRVVRTAMDASGRPVRVWVYLGRRFPTDARRIRGGRWTPLAAVRNRRPLSRLKPRDGG